MFGRGFVVVVTAVMALAAAAGCASSGGTEPASAVSRSAPAAGSVTASSSSESSAGTGTQGLSASDRALATEAAHQVANQVAVGRNNPQVAGWPSGISGVTAVVQSATVTDSNTGHRCESGTIIGVRLVGAFDTVTTGTLSGTGTSSPDTAVREMDLNVDATTGLTCLISVRTEPIPPSPDASMLFSR